MSVLSRPRLPHLDRHADPTTAPGSAPQVPTQRGGDVLRPWSPGHRSPRPAQPLTTGDRRRRAALALAGLAVVGAGAAGLAVAAPWDDDPAPAPAAPTTVSVTTTDQQRDASLAGRGPAGSLTGAGSTDVSTSTDAQRDAVLQQRGGLFP